MLLDMISKNILFDSMLWLSWFQSLRKPLTHSFKINKLKLINMLCKMPSSSIFHYLYSFFNLISDMIRNSGCELEDGVGAFL